MSDIASPLCTAVAQLKVGGAVVAEFTCGLDFGHGDFGVPHQAALTWADEAIVTLPDFDLLDPDEELVDPTPTFPTDGPCPVEGCALEAGHNGVHED